MGAAFVALCLLTQLGTATHLLFVRHAFCAAHGIAVDVDGQSADGHTHRSTTKAATDALGQAGDEAEHEAHDHCALAIHRWARATLASASALPQPAPLVLVSEREPIRVAQSSGAHLLFLAPKTSPPA